MPTGIERAPAPRVNESENFRYKREIRKSVFIFRDFSKIEKNSDFFIVAIKKIYIYIIFFRQFCVAVPLQEPRFITQPSGVSNILTENHTKILQCQARGESDYLYFYLLIFSCKSMLYFFFFVYLFKNLRKSVAQKKLSHRSVQVVSGR